MTSVVIVTLPNSFTPGRSCGVLWSARAICMSICLYVCLSVCPLLGCPKRGQTSRLHHVFCICWLWPWLDQSFDLRLLCTSGFVDVVVLSYGARDGRVSGKTRTCSVGCAVQSCLVEIVVRRGAGWGEVSRLRLQCSGGATPRQLSQVKWPCWKGYAPALAVALAERVGKLRIWGCSLHRCPLTASGIRNLQFENCE